MSDDFHTFNEMKLMAVDSTWEQATKGFRREHIYMIRRWLKANKLEHQSELMRVKLSKMGYMRSMLRDSINNASDHILKVSNGYVTVPVQVLFNEHLPHRDRTALLDHTAFIPMLLHHEKGELTLYTIKAKEFRPGTKIKRVDQSKPQVHHRCRLLETMEIKVQFAKYKDPETRKEKYKPYVQVNVKHLPGYPFTHCSVKLIAAPGETFSRFRIVPIEHEVKQGYE